MISNEQREKIYKLLKDKKDCKFIERETGIGYAIILRVRNELEAEGRIPSHKKEKVIKKTREEVEVEIKDRFVEIYDEDISDEKKMKILGLKKAKYYRIKRELEIEGRIINRGNRRHLESPAEKNNERLRKQREYIIKLLRLGFETNQIATIIGRNMGIVEIEEEDLVNNNRISRETIEKARKEKGLKAKLRRREIRIANIEAEIPNIEILQAHLEYCKGQLKLGELEEIDVRVLDDAIKYNPKFMTPANINLVVTYYTRNNKNRSAIRFINQCLDETRNNEEIQNMLIEGKKLVQHSIKLEEARRLLGHGYYTENDIANEVGLRVKDVMRLKDEMKKARAAAAHKEKSEVQR